VSMAAAGRRWHVWRARRLARLAAAHLARGTPDLAREYAERSLRQWVRAPDTPIGRAAAACLLGQAADQRGNPRLAAPILAAAMDLTDGIPEATAVHVDLLIRQGDLLRRLHQFDTADLQFADAQALLHEAEPELPELRAAAVNGWGIVAKDTGQWRDAAERYCEALRLAEAEGFTVLAATVQHNLGGLAHAEGRYEDGVRHAQQAVGAHTRLLGTAHPVVAGDLGVLGANLAGLGELDAARSSFSRALDLFRHRFGPDHYEVAVILHNLAAVDALEGDVDGALRHCQRALSIKAGVLGEDHPECHELRDCLASLQATGRCEGRGRRGAPPAGRSPAQPAP
jgi:tetratricopeptide (TPR) repeat protein